MIIPGMIPDNTLLGGLSLPGVAPTVDLAKLYDLSNPAALTELDSENFPVDIANTNVAGAVDFGNGRLYILDTNNGLLALEVTVPEPAAVSLVGLVGPLARRRPGG